MRNIPFRSNEVLSNLFLRAWTFWQIFRELSAESGRVGSSWMGMNFLFTIQLLKFFLLVLYTWIVMFRSPNPPWFCRKFHKINHALMNKLKNLPDYGSFFLLTFQKRFDFVVQRQDLRWSGGKFQKDIHSRVLLLRWKTQDRQTLLAKH